MPASHSTRIVPMRNRDGQSRKQFHEIRMSCTVAYLIEYAQHPDVQARFLRAVGLTEEEALLNFRLAPLSMRRCIAILGFLHRVVLGLTSTQIGELFPLAAANEARDHISAQVRGVAQKHSKQFMDRINPRSSEHMKRSIFGMIQCYNALPQYIVDEPTVSSFQRRLQL